MDLGLAGRTALVTGASKGIGLATARLLASEGCDVAIVARSADALEAEAASIGEEFGVRALAVPADLSRGDEVERVWATLSGEAFDGGRPFGLPDIVVNNAGATPRGGFADIDEATWRTAWELKVFGYVAMCRLAMRDMSARGSGVIVNIIGSSGARPSADYVAGGTGNAALMALTIGLGGSSLRSGVRVVGINPGSIKTGRLVARLKYNARTQLGDESRWEELLDQTYPPGEPDHIAAAVAFLASDRSSYTSGVVLAIDGGTTAR